MKRLFTILLLVTTCNIFAQTAKVDTVVTEKWNGSAWVNDTKTIYTYDGDCQLTSLLIQSWNAGTSAWINSALTTYTYGSNGLPSVELLQTWNTGTSSWDDAERKTNTYDGSNKLSSYTTDIYFLGSWTLFSQTTYTYDASNYIDSILTQTAFPGPLTNSTLALYTNNSDGTPSQVVLQNWNLISSSWDNLTRNTFTYTGSMIPSTILIEQWQSSAWVNFEFTTNTISGDKVTTSLNQTWNGTAWVDDSRSTYTYSTSCTLPLKLISFTATKNKNIVTLNWQTAEEINTSHFNIQRSVDGVNFSNIGNVTARGRDGQSYSYSDNTDNIATGKVYYRLQMMDKDGKYSFSKIIPLTLELFAGNIKTYPNPVKDQLYILFNAQNAGKAIIRVSDASGKIVHTENVSTTATAINVNVSRLGKGVYYVQLITDKVVQRTTFMKQ